MKNLKEYSEKLLESNSLGKTLRSERSLELGDTYPIRGIDQEATTP